jgi:hypothetical protein
VGLYELPEPRVPHVDAGHAEGTIAWDETGEGEVGAEPADVGAGGDPYLDVANFRRYFVRSEQAVEQHRDPIGPGHHHSLARAEDEGVRRRRKRDECFSAISAVERLAHGQEPITELAGSGLALRLDRGLMIEVLCRRALHATGGEDEQKPKPDWSHTSQFVPRCSVKGRRYQDGMPPTSVNPDLRLRPKVTDRGSNRRRAIQLTVDRDRSILQRTL